MSWQDVTPSEEVEVALWIRERLHPFAQDVGSVVPPGFAAYARIFHPASRARTALDQPEVEVRWAEVAAWNGKVVHPEMQFHSLGGPWHGSPQALGPEIYEPGLGALSKRHSAALVGLLSKHTTTPELCWLCLWDGYGDLHPGSSSWLIAFRSDEADTQHTVPPEPRFPSQRSRVRLPGRDYLLFTGSVTQAEGWDEGPNLWWPADRAWCVASEIDLPYTYVGGPTILIEEILGNENLEALAARLADGISAVSDKINK